MPNLSCAHVSWVDTSSKDVQRDPNRFPELRFHGQPTNIHKLWCVQPSYEGTVPSDRACSYYGSCLELWGRRDAPSWVIPGGRIPMHAAEDFLRPPICSSRLERRAKTVLEVQPGEDKMSQENIPGDLRLTLPCSMWQ